MSARSAPHPPSPAALGCPLARIAGAVPSAAEAGEGTRPALRSCIVLFWRCGGVRQDGMRRSRRPDVPNTYPRPYPSE